MKEMHIITDLQYGSTGKGLFAGYLAHTLQPDTVMIAWGPNAGHTFIDADGEKMVNVALPNGIVSPKLKRIMIGPGSVINPELLMSEIDRYGKYIAGATISIHECAAVVSERHREEEAGTKIGSTMKGVGAAIREKIKRDPADKIIARDALKGTPLEGYLVDDSIYALEYDLSERVLVEGSQGYSLSINHGFYPYVTSRDCTTMQILSDCGVPFGKQGTWRAHMNVYGVCRTFPIRVNNRGHWSGPCFPDQEETTWEKLGIEPELTTVTRLPRRVFTFSMEQVKAACRQNGVNRIFLNFANYMTLTEVEELTADINRRTLGTRVSWLGCGPKVTDIREV